jgi:hypothetical protein
MTLVLIGLIALLGGMVIDGRLTPAYRGRRRMTPVRHRDAGRDRAPRALLSGMHRPDMYGKAPR